MSKEDDDDFDPHLHREIEAPITNFEALVNLLKAIIGNGVLALPLAFYHAGWLNGIISTFVIGSIVTYSKHILIQSMYELCKRERTDFLAYSDSMALALKEGPPCVNCLSPAGRVLVDFLLTFYHFGTCCVYVVFVANNIKEVVDFHLYELDVRIYVMCLTLPLILIYLIRDLKHLVPFSCISNVLLLSGYGFILYYVLSALPSMSTIKPFNDIRYYPLFYGTLLFSTEAVGLVIVIERNMKKPKELLGLTGVLNQGMFIILTLNAAFGFLGYWRYGDDIKGSITLNLPEKELLPDIIKIVFAFAVYLSYPLQGYITIDVVWTNYLSKKVAEQKQRPLEYVVRILIVLGTVICAIVFPNLGLFLSLVGSFGFSLLGLVMPAIVHSCVRYKLGYGTLKVYLFQDIFIFAFGVAGCTLGTYVSIIEMVKDYKNLNSD